MSKIISLNAFDRCSLGHVSPGLWRHPDDHRRSYNRPDYWINLARIAEQGLFDSVFLADSYNTRDVYRGGPETSVRYGVSVPSIDPFLVVPYMAQATQDICFALTANVSYEPIFSLARRLSTLDHLTGGRLGWNIVTGTGDNAARAFGFAKQRQHDQRYQVAEEYMQAIYRLFEGSWEDGAVIADYETGIFADPARVHTESFEGQFSRFEAVHQVEPSPQKTPLLFQAGASSTGRAFAARHAEASFVAGHSMKVVGPRIADARRLAAVAGRQPDDIRFFLEIAIIAGETDAEAEKKLAEYRSFSVQEGVLAFLSGTLGIDLSRYKLSEELRYIEGNAVQSIVEEYTIANPDRVWTVGDLLEYAAVGGPGAKIIGSAKTIADTLEDWVETTDLDGFNLLAAINPTSYEDFVRLVVPELQRRGIYKTAYEPGTFRQKLFGQDRRFLDQAHPGSSYRRHSDAEAA